MPQHSDEPIVETTDKARAGETGHNVRYVLIFGIGGVILVFAVVFLLSY